MNSKIQFSSIKPRYNGLQTKEPTDVPISEEIRVFSDSAVFGEEGALQDLR